MRTNTRYIVLLSVLTLTLLLSQIFLQRSISRSQMDSYIINVSGRQRMLSQKIAKHALQLRSHVDAPNWNEIIPELNNTLAEWEKGLHYLTEDDGATLANQRVLELFNEARPFFSHIQEAAKELTDMYQNEKVDVEKAEFFIHVIDENESGFLDLMDEITFELDRISQDKITYLRTVEIVLLSFTLLILVLEVYLIYQPLRKSLKHKDSANRNLTQIIESLENYSVLLLDNDFRIKECNKGSSALFGYEKEELMDKTVSILFGSEMLLEFKTNDWNAAIENRGMVPLTGLHLNKKGEEIYCSSTLLKVKNAENEPVGFTLLTLDQTLYQTNRILAAQNKELEKFNYIASHDLKEPLRTIKGFLNLMKNEYKNELNDSYQTMMNHIVHSADRMENLIQSLLNYAQTGANIRFIELDLNPLMKAVTNDLKELIDSRSVDLEISKLPKLIAASTEMRQLFQNLIANGIKYTPTNRLPTLKISHSEEERFYHFTVQDNGYGIEERFLEEIFQPFKRLHGTDSAEGQGLGLAHCQKIVELHGGKIWVESVVNEGSVFHFTLSKELKINS